MMTPSPSRLYGVMGCGCGMKLSEKARLPIGTIAVIASHRMLADPYLLVLADITKMLEDRGLWQSKVGFGRVGRRWRHVRMKMSSVDGRGGGSSAWHINEMGPPYRSDG